MTAGGPGDHPVTDILHWNLEVYGETADAEFRELALLLSDRELNEWWQQSIGWNAEQVQAAAAIRKKLAWARQRAKDSGWE